MGFEERFEEGKRDGTTQAIWKDVPYTAEQQEDAQRQYVFHTHILHVCNSHFTHTRARAHTHTRCSSQMKFHLTSTGKKTSLPLTLKKIHLENEGRGKWWVAAGHISGNFWVHIITAILQELYVLLHSRKENCSKSESSNRCGCKLTASSIVL